MIYLLFAVILFFTGCRKDFEHVPELNDVFRKLKGKWIMDSLVSSTYYNQNYQVINTSEGVFENGIYTIYYDENVYCGPGPGCHTYDTARFQMSSELEFKRLNEMNKKLIYSEKTEKTNLTNSSDYSLVDQIWKVDWRKIDRDTSIYLLQIGDTKYEILELTDNLLKLEYGTSSSSHTVYGSNYKRIVYRKN